MSLHAPLATLVEVRAPKRRVFRLSRSVGEDAVVLELPAPFEPGRPVMVRIALPDGVVLPALAAEIALGDDDGEGEHGGSWLRFRDAPSDVRRQIAAYVRERLGLPFLS